MLYAAIALAIIAGIAHWQKYPRIAFWAAGAAGLLALISVVLLFASAGA